MSLNTRGYTILGFVTIIIWGTSAAFTRNLSTSLGPYSAASLVNIIGGVAVVVRQILTGEGISEWRKAPAKYWILCGLLFIVYNATSYLSVGVLVSQKSVVTVVLIKFLWPLLTLVGTIPILKAKASPWLTVGVLTSLMGIAVAILGEKAFDLTHLIGNLVGGGDVTAVALGFVVAISWALYTNLTKKFIGESRVDGVGLYMLVSGIVLGLIAVNVDEPRHFSIDIVAQMLYAALIVGCLANLSWTLAIKRGNMLLVVLASNFLPIMSTIMTAIMLGVPITPPIIVGSALVVVGTMWSKKCFEGR
jgi:drug/metabolite transporter (DMT)-like permease